jgi:L-lactate dehydrogenase complex protein LldG
MSASRDAILNAIRSKTLEPTPLPTLEQDWIRFNDPISQFGTVLESVGGKCVRCESLATVQETLDDVVEFRTAVVRCSTVEGIGKPTLSIDDVDDPHALETVDFAVLRGQFAVAENGAVWVTDAGLGHRVPYFLSQHLALIVPSSEVIPNMHQAYQRLTFEGRGFGCFISGPSKTADIEQSLVIGAHGPRSHIVFLVDSLDG